MKNELIKKLEELTGKKVTLTEAATSYSTQQMEQFLSELGNTIAWQNKQTINLPSTYPSSSVSFNKEQLNKNWNQAKSLYPDATWTIWKADVGGSANKPIQTASGYDMNSILAIVKKYPEAFRGMSISASNNFTQDANISTQGD